MSGSGLSSVAAELTEITARMIAILHAMGDGENGSEVARTRVQVLNEFL